MKSRSDRASILPEHAHGDQRGTRARHKESSPHVHVRTLIVGRPTDCWARSHEKVAPRRLHDVPVGEEAARHGEKLRDAAGRRVRHAPDRTRPLRDAAEASTIAHAHAEAHGRIRSHASRQLGYWHSEGREQAHGDP